MASLKEQTSAGFRRVAAEINKVREEMQEITPSGSGTAADTSYGNYGYETVGDALDSLLYKAIAINSFSHNAGTKEMGSTVTSVTLSWSTNKTPTGLTLDGEAIDVSLTSKALTGLSITSNKSFTLVATDEKDATATKTATISFLNGLYYGIGTVDASGITDSFIQGLTKTLTSSKAKTFTVDPASGEYIYYAIPTRFGTPTFYVGGFEGGFELLTTVQYTNASGYSEAYDVHRSTNAGLGSTEVVVK